LCLPKHTHLSDLDSNYATVLSILISHFYCTKHLSANSGYIMHIALRMSSVHPSVTLVYCDHTHRDYQKVIFWINSVILV